MVGPKIIAALDVYSIGILYTRTRAYVNGGVGLAPSRPLVLFPSLLPPQLARTRSWTPRHDQERESLALLFDGG